MAIISKKKGGQVLDISSVDNYLGIEGITGELRYAGKGVAYCSICDAPLFIDKDVLIAAGDGAVAALAANDYINKKIINY